jgi:hypothetical protein
MPEKIQTANPPDPTINVRELIDEATGRVDDLRAVEVRRLDEKISASDDKYQIQFNAAKEAVGIALIAQEKEVASALEGTREAISKADATTDKRFDLLSEKIDGVMEIISKSTGAQGIYVTHSDLDIAMDRLQASIEATLRPVVTFMNNSQGQQRGVSSSWGVLIAVIGATSAIVAVLSRFLK